MRVRRKTGASLVGPYTGPGYTCYTSLVAQTVKNLPVIWEPGVQSLGREDPLEKGMAAYSIFLPGESH